MKWLVKVIFKAVKLLINLILLPIDTLVSAAFPSLSHGLSLVNSFFEWVADFIKFILSWLPFDTNFYVFLVGALVFYYSIPLLVHAIKLVVKWYNVLKP